MKFIFLAVFPMFLFVGLSLAEIKKTDLEKKVVLTEEAMLLSQVDTVSLYLSSDRAVFAPRLTKEKVIEIELTVLDTELISDGAKLKDYVTRLIGTFVSVLEERLPDFAPAIAKKFNANKDIIFVINGGTSRTSLGMWKSGVLELNPNVVLPVTVPTPTTDSLNQVRADEAAKSAEIVRKGCGCPALRK